MVQPAVRCNYPIIDLTSDNEDDQLPADEVANLAAKSFSRRATAEENLNLDAVHRYGQSAIHQQNVIELVDIPDADVPPFNFSPLVAEYAALNDNFNEAGIISESVCLQLVLDVLPDVSIDHVLGLIKARTTDQTRCRVHSEQIVNELLENTYPKEADILSKKKKRTRDEEGDEVSDYEKDKCGAGVLTYNKDA